MKATLRPPLAPHGLDVPIDLASMRLETMTPSDASVLREWLTAEGYDPGVRVEQLAWAFEAGALLCVRIGGIRVGGIFASRFEGELGSVGYAVVRPGLRGRGIGARMVDLALERLGPGPIAAEVPPRVARAAMRRGFTVAHRTVEYRCVAPSDPLVAEGRDIVPALEVPLRQIADLDERATGVRRDGLIHHWLTDADSVALAVRRNPDALAAYGLLRESRGRFRLGPLFAEDEATAQRLYEALLSRAGPGQSVSLVMQCSKPHVQRFARRNGLQANDQRVVVTRGTLPSFDVGLLYSAPSWFARD